LEWNLENEIESLREEMITAATKEGITADETIGFSRRLDNLMNQYEELKMSDS
jgi:hypothetical protein